MKQGTLDIDSIRKKLSSTLTGERFRHSESVCALSMELAKRWGVSEDKAAVAGLLHDCSRWMSGKQMISRAKKLKMPIGEVELSEPKLFHAELSAHIAKADFGVRDKDILSAIQKHTLGSVSMSVLDKIIYLADHVEPERDYAGVDDVRRLAFKDLNKAVIESINSMIKALLIRGLPIHPQTIETRNGLLLEAQRN